MENNFSFKFPRSGLSSKVHLFLEAYAGAVAFLLLCLGSSAALGSTVNVGDPSNPSALAAALQSAYAGGASTIVINPGTYTIPSGNNALPLNNWSNVTVSCSGCTFVDTDPTGSDSLWSLSHCTNVIFEGGTITCSNMPMSENPIVSLGAKDGSGYQTYNVSTPAGYPALTPGSGNQFCDVVDGKTFEYKLATGDFYKATITSLGSGEYNVDFNQGCPILAVGGLIVSRSSTMCGYKIHLGSCTSCTVQNVVLYRNGFSNIREDGCSGDVFNNITWAPGPAPTGGTKIPITYENCLMTGLLNDDDIAIHGYTLTVASVSGSTISVADNTFSGQPHPLVGESMQVFNATYFGQGTITAVSDNGTTTSITISNISGIPSGCLASDPNRCGAGYRIIQCELGSTRSRGIIAKASNGLIQGNTISNPGIAGILAGYEGFPSGEGGYVSNVMISDNTINGCAQMQPGISYGAIYLAPPGPEGNQNISVENNILSNVAGVSVLVTGDNGVQIAYNTFANTALYTNDYHLLNVKMSNAVALTNNLLTNRGAYTASPWYQYDSASTNLTGLNTSGVATGMYNTGIYLMQHSGTSEFIDVPNNSPNTGTGLEQESYVGTDEQLWVPVNLENGYYTLGHFGTNQVMNTGGSGVSGTQITQYPDTTSSNLSWAITDQGNGTQKLLSGNSGLALDSYGNNSNNGAIIDEATPTGSTGQSWIMTFVAPAAGANLIQNFSFEANGFTYSPSNWTQSGTANASYTQEDAAQDGNYNLVMYATSPWNSNVSQTVTGLTNGLYSATAYVQTSANIAQAYMFAASYGGSNLYAYAPKGAGGGLAGWKEITIPYISVTNGQCTIGFYGQDTAGNNPFYIDNVQLVPQH
jgi:hypothetical protein